MEMRSVKSVVQILATGYIFVYFSEHLFWARPRPDDSLSGWFGAWMAYSIMAYLFLLIVAHFRVQTISALFLAGAAFGWIGEGIVVQTAYEMLPLSISFTGLAWHALLTVWVGWYAVRQSFLAADRWSTLKLAAVMGLAYGLWAMSWWVEPAPEGGISSVSTFALYSFTTTGLVIAAYWLANWSSSDLFVINRLGVLIVVTIVAGYFCIVTVPAAPLSLVLLPILFGLLYRGLRENYLRKSDGSLLETLHRRVSPWKFISLLALAAFATLVYALATVLQWRWHTNWILYLITTPLGFIVLGISLYRLLRKDARVSSEVTG